MMDELKTQMKEQITRAAKLSKEAMVAFDNDNFKEGKRLMKLAREAANNFQKLYQSKQVSSAK